jgi:hypothetical protein
MANNKIRKYANAGRVKGGKGIAAAGLFDRLNNDAAMLRNQRMGTKFQDLGPSTSDVIKAENGNWTGGEKVNSVDRNLMLMNRRTLEGHTPESELNVLNRVNQPELRELHTARQNEETDHRIREATHLQALNKWINGNLKNYIKKQMATPSDPVRLMMDQRADEIRQAYLADRKKGQDMLTRAKQLDDPRKAANLEREAKKLLKDATEHRELALENIGHMTPRQMREHTGTMINTLDEDDALRELQNKRADEGFQSFDLARNKSAQAWERLTDTAIAPTTKQKLLDSAEANKKFQELQVELIKLKDENKKKSVEKFVEQGLDLDTAKRMVEHMSYPEHAEFSGGLEAKKEISHKEMAYSRGHHKDLYENQPNVETLQANPFIEKLDPEQKLYNIHKYYSGNDIFGMDKVVDLLKKDLTAGRIRPEQLNKLTVEQAVERVGRQNLKAAQEAKEARIKSMADMPVYKEYPEEGYKWVQLTRPGQFAQESDVMGHSVRGYEPPRGHPEYVPESDGSGHDAYGLGGYGAIKSGKAKIYSLRDAAGNAHATIEVKAPKNLHIREYLEGLPEDEIIKLKEGVAKEGLNPESSYALMKYVEEHSPEYQAANKEYKTTYAPDINQIKGKQNEPVHEDYLKYVQDFVQSGKFNEVSDLHNADLRSVSGIDPSVVRKLGLKIPKYLNEQQIRDLNEAIYNYRPEMGEPQLIPLPESIQKFRTPPEEGMKQGGPVAKSHHYHKIARDFGLPHLSEGGGLKDDEESKIDDMIQTMHANVADLHEKLPNYAQSNVRSSAHPALASMPHSPDNEGPRPFMSGRGNQDFGHYRAGVEVPIGPVNLRASAGSHFGRNLDTAGNLRHIGLDAPLLGGRLHLDATRDPKIGHKEYKLAYERHFKDGSKGGVHYQDPLGAPDYELTQDQQDTAQDYQDAARNMYYNDKRHLVTPKGKKEFGLQVAANYAGIPVDTVNWLGGMAAEGLDATAGKALGKMFPEHLTKPVSVLNPNGERVLAHPLSDKFPDAPRGGSRDLTSRLGHDYEFASAPLAGGALDIGAPALVKGAMALPRAPRAIESGLNSVNAAARRPFTPATMTIEATAPDLGQRTSMGYRQGLNDRLISNERGGTDLSTVAGQPTTRREGQGAWMGSKGFETNPLTAIDVPRAGDLSKNEEFMRQLAQAGTNLNQEGMAAHRFMPNLTGNPKDASAMLIKNRSGVLSNDEVINLAKELGSRMVVAHNPRLGGIVVHPFGEAEKGVHNKFAKQAKAKARKVLGKEADITYGTSDINKDRAFSMGAEDYAKAGAKPASEDVNQVREMLKRQAREAFPNGDAPSGGVQPWSIGENYPTHVQGIGNGDLVEHRPVNYATGEIGQTYPTYAEAEAARAAMLNAHHRSLPKRVR